MPPSKSKSKRPVSAVAAMLEGITPDDLLDDDELEIDVDYNQSNQDYTKKEQLDIPDLSIGTAESEPTLDQSSQVVKIPCNKIDLWQFTDRSELSMGDQEKLKTSIKELGQNQPALVRKNGDRFELIFGHRRFKACQSLGIDLLCKICSLDNEKAALIQISENVDREDISDFDRGSNFENLLSNNVFSNVKELAEKTHFQITKIYELLTFSKIPFHIREMIKIEKLSSRTSSDLCSLIKDKKYDDHSDEIVRLINENPVRRDLRKAIDLKINSMITKKEDKKVELDTMKKSIRKDRVILTLSLDNKNVEKVASIEKEIERLLSKN